jgi:hypothetical protein
MHLPKSAVIKEEHQNLPAATNTTIKHYRRVHLQLAQERQTHKTTAYISQSKQRTMNRPEASDP